MLSRCPEQISPGERLQPLECGINKDASLQVYSHKIWPYQYNGLHSPSFQYFDNLHTSDAQPDLGNCNCVLEVRHFLTVA